MFITYNFFFQNEIIIISNLMFLYFQYLIQEIYYCNIYYINDY